MSTTSEPTQRSAAVNGVELRVAQHGEGLPVILASAVRSTRPLRFGSFFFAPFHPVDQDPRLGTESDLGRVLLGRLGHDECWLREHHPGGYRFISCPESTSRRS